MIVTNACKHCGGPIEADHEELNRTVPCPHCRQDTFLAAPKRPPARFLRQPAGDSKASLVYLVVMVLGFIVAFGMVNGAIGIQGAVLLVVLALVYFVPSILGHKKRNASAILLLNIFLGWTLVGWVVALVWAVTKDLPAGLNQRMAK